MSYPRQDWRLLITSSSHGAWNMAVDEALLEAVEVKRSVPILRLYSWTPACLSIGYAQPVDQVDRRALRRRRWDLVRRPTGGRAILHTDELTYSVVAPMDEPRLEGDIVTSYRRLSRPACPACSRRAHRRSCLPP